MKAYRCAALVLVASGCAAVTGLADYEVVDCPDCVDAAADASPDTRIDTSLDAFVPPSDATNPPSAEAGTDAGGTVDAGPDVVIGSYAPSCARTSCGGVTYCKDEPCDANLKWPFTITTTGKVSTSSGTCDTTTGGGDSTAFVRETLAVTSNFDFELRFLLKTYTADNQTTAVIARLVSDTTTITLESDKSQSVRLCVNGDCSANLTPLVLEGGAVDLYGRWGTGGTNGYVRLLAGAPNDCKQRLERALPTAAKATLAAEVGCFDKRCSLTFDEVSFNLRPF